MAFFKALLSARPRVLILTSRLSPPNTDLPIHASAHRSLLLAQQILNVPEENATEKLPPPSRRSRPYRSWSAPEKSKRNESKDSGPEIPRVIFHGVKLIRWPGRCRLASAAREILHIECSGCVARTGAGRGLVDVSIRRVIFKKCNKV